MSNDTTVRIKSIHERLVPHLSNLALSCFRASAFPAPDEDTLQVSRAYHGEPTDLEVRRLGADLNAMAELLRWPYAVGAVEHVKTTMAPDGQLSPTMTVPHSDGSVHVVMYVRFASGRDPEVRRWLAENVLAHCRLAVGEIGKWTDVHERW